VPIYQGEPVPLTYTNTDVNGNPVNPASTQPVCTVTLPDETTATPTVTNTGPGQFTATYDTTETGRHQVTWICADATYPGAFADVFDVEPTASSNVLSFADAKNTLSIPASNAQWDDWIQHFNAAVTSWLEWYCGPIVQQTIQETLRVGGLVVQLSKPPVLELVEWTSVPTQLANDTGFSVASANSGPMFPVMVYGVAYPLNQLVVEPVKGWVRHTSGLPFYYGPFIWQYTAGRVQVPDSIMYAARTILRHLFAQFRGGAGGAVALGAADEETSETPFGFAIPNRVIEMLVNDQIPAAIA
jgi:hypothetical protein